MNRLLILEDLNSAGDLADQKEIFEEELRDLEVEVSIISPDTLSFNIYVEEEEDFSSIIGWIVAFAYCQEYYHLITRVGVEEC